MHRRRRRRRLSNATKCASSKYKEKTKTFFFLKDTKTLNKKIDCFTAFSGEDKEEEEEERESFGFSLGRMFRSLSRLPRKPRSSFSFRSLSSSSSSSSSPSSSSAGAPGAEEVVARSLAELNRLGKSATRLELESSKDIVCRDIQCERVTKACSCKLSVAIEKSGQNLRAIDLSNNRLESIPESLFDTCSNLERLSLRNNQLTVEAIGKHYKLRKLKLLELGGNPGMDLSVECYNRLAKRNVKVRI